MKSLRTIFFVLLAVDILGIGGLWYGSVVMQNEKSIEASLRKDLLSEEMVREKTQAQKRDLTATEADRHRLAQFMFQPTDEDQIRFITSIERLGTSTSGALVETVSLDGSKPGVFSGNFSIQGTWPQVHHVLRLIEEFPARIVINRFDAKELQSGSWASAVQIDVVSVKIPPKK